jgi:hypothetical protein
MISTNITLGKLCNNFVLNDKEQIVFLAGVGAANKRPPAPNSCSKWSVYFGPNAGRKLLGDLFLEVSLSPVRANFDAAAARRAASAI